MKKIAITVTVIMLIFLASAVIAEEKGKTGQLLLFQKCDRSLIGKSSYDPFGCPDIGTGPWPIFPGNGRRGTLEYTFWGKEFAFSFEGQKLLPEKNYMLIYYPDPWPGDGLICLGSGKTDRDGNIKINGEEDIGTSLPARYDANFNPVSPSGAVGAKIWLVLTDDVQCINVAQMLNWNPSAYLFEYNLIVYENTEMDFGDNENGLYTGSTFESLNNGSQSDATEGIKSAQVQVGQAKPIISASPKSLNFGSVRVGSTSDPKTVTIKNAGNGDLIVTSVDITGTNAAEFSQTNSCSTIPAKGTCAVIVTFIPSVPFAKKNAVMTISCNDPNKPSINVKLSGQAPPPKISVAPMSVNFGSVAAGDSSTPRAVTIKNTGISDLAVNSITITGANATEFGQTNDCLTVAKGGSCAVTLIFSPTSSGSKTATMSILTNDPKKQTINVKLSGRSSGGSAPALFYVYKDYGAVENHFIPSGWMGDGDFASAISFNDAWASNCQSGSCMKISFNQVNGNNWAGIYWQDPEDNWGNDPTGGFNLAGCTRIDFMARGEKGESKSNFLQVG